MLVNFCQGISPLWGKSVFPNYFGCPKIKMSRNLSVNVKRQLTFFSSVFTQTDKNTRRIFSTFRDTIPVDARPVIIPIVVCRGRRKSPFKLIKISEANKRG
jgi:hypothetical protein